MPIQIGPKGATIDGVSYPAHAYIDTLSPRQEALALQGGDARRVSAPEAQARGTGKGSYFLSADGGTSRVPSWVSAPWSVALAASIALGAYSEVGPQPFAARDSNAYATGVSQPFIVDNEGMMQATLAGELLHWGMRREHNLCRNTDQLTFTGTDGWSPVNGCTVAPVWSDIKPRRYWAQPDSPQGGTVWKISSGAQVNSVLRSQSGYVLEAVPHVWAVELWADTPHQAELRCYVSAGVSHTKVVDVTTTPQLFYLPFTPDGTSAYIYSIAPLPWASTAAGYVYACDPRLHQRTGAVLAPPTEYVPRDSFPRGLFWHGAGVDGVAYFGTTNANTLNAGTGVVTKVAGAEIARYGGIATGPTYAQMLNTDWSTWTRTGLGANVTGVTGPDGKASAIDVVESTTGSAEAHHISASLLQSAVYEGKWVVLSVVAKTRGAGDRQWLRVVIADVDGGATLKSAYFNVGTGAVGTVSAGCFTEVEALGGGRWRFFLRCALGDVGSPTNAVARYYVCTADNTPTHIGDVTKGMTLAFPNATSALQNAVPTNPPTGADRAVPCPYAPNTSTTSVVTVQGQSVGYQVLGLVDRTDFAVSSIYTPYYTPAAPFKGGAGNNYSAVTYFRCEQPIDTISTFSDFDTMRTGLTIRPNFQNTAHYSKWAFDLYPGNPNSQFFWRPETRYELGDIVIPRDTQANNNNARKMYTCTQAGVSGTGEPLWNTAGFPTVEQTDGTCKWQSNHDNGINGNWEPYMGAHLVPPNNTMLVNIKCAWFVTATSYGCFIDGVECVKQTLPQFEKGMSTVLPYRPKTLWLGQMGTNKGTVSGAAAAGTAQAELMGVYWAFHKQIVVRHTCPALDLL